MLFLRGLNSSHILKHLTLYIITHILLLLMKRGLLWKRMQMLKWLQEILKKLLTNWLGL